MREGAAFCDKCGTPMAGNGVRQEQQPSSGVLGGEVYRSTRLWISTQLLLVAMSFIAFGFMALVMAAVVAPFPNMNDPFGSGNDYTFNTIVGAMGIVTILLGVGILVLAYYRSKGS